MKMNNTDWNFSDDAEIQFQEWFNDFYGDFSFRSEYFYGDCEVKDEKTLKDIMYKWIHAAFVTGFERGRTPDELAQEHSKIPQDAL